MNGIGRNAICPCGSGKKHKHCCGRQTSAAAPADAASRLLQSALVAHRSGQLQQAKEYCHQALRVAPEHPDALHLLGLFARQEGYNELAVDLISKAVRLYPAPPFYFNLGNAYQALGKMNEAVDSFNRALALNPNYVAALNNLGIALQHQGKMEASINTFQQALKLQPDYAELYSNLADVLRENRQLEASITCARHAISLNPGFFNAHFCLGKVLHDQGFSTEALRSFKQALALNSAHAETHIAISNVYFSGGQFEESRVHIEHALNIAPESPEAWASLAFLKKMGAEDNQWAEKALSLLTSKLKPKENAQLSYALGKYYDDTAQYDLAFPHFLHANQMQLMLHEGFDREGHRWLVDTLIETNTRERMRERCTGVNLSDRPVFIVGMPRSGTSLMEQILASHDKIFGAGELGFWNQAAVDHLAGMPNWSRDTALLQTLASGYTSEMSRHSAEALRIVDKMPANFLNLGLIHAAFPNARIIHMMRDPLDTCLSIFFQGFSGLHPYANDLSDLTFYYREYRRLMAHWRNVLPPETLIEVSYEDLIENQESLSRRVVEFLGLEWDDNCLNFHQTDRRVGTASNWQVRQKIYRTSKERWRNYQSFIEPLLPLLESEGEAGKS